MLQSLKDEHEIKAALLWRMATDKELFAAKYFPHYCKYPFNEFHRDMFNDSDFDKRAIRFAGAAPRGTAKSTVIALIEPIHDVCYGLENYIIVISNTQNQSDQKLADIRNEILTNTALVDDYGIHFRTKKPGETQYTVYCGDHACRFESYGAGVEIRGVRFGEHRPTKILLDDAEHSEEVLNEAIRKKYEDWFKESVSKLGSNDTNIKVVGTILHRESLLNHILKNPAYTGKIYKAIVKWSPRQDLWNKWTALYTNLDNPTRFIEAQEFYNQNEVAMLAGTQVLWPEKEPYLFLMKELIEIGKRAFMKEKQNAPMGGDDALFENVHWYRETADGFLIESTGKLIPWDKLKDRKGQWLNSYGVIDPATGQTKAKQGKLGDFSCILTGISDGVPDLTGHKNRLFVHADSTKRMGPSKFIKEVFEHYLVYDYQKFGVETNLYRDLLLPNLVAERKRREVETKRAIHLPFYDIENVDNKEKRIYTLEPKTTHGWILFNRALSQEFIGQLEAFPHGDHDDAPDALEMLWGLVNNRFKPSAVSMDAMGAR